MLGCGEARKPQRWRFWAWMAIQRPRRIRKRSSIAVKVIPETLPQRRDSRSLATDRMSSHLIKLLTLPHPQGGSAGREKGCPCRYL